MSISCYEYHIHFKDHFIASIEVPEGKRLQDAIDELLAQVGCYTNEDITHTSYIGKVENTKLAAERNSREQQAQTGNPHFQIQAIQSEIDNLLGRAVNLLGLGGYNELDGELDDLRVKIKRAFAERVI